MWIEAWNLHLLRVATNEALLTFLRTVNNRDMPASLSGAFSTVAEGRVIRAAE